MDDETLLFSNSKWICYAMFLISKSLQGIVVVIVAPLVNALISWLKNGDRFMYLPFLGNCLVPTSFARCLNFKFFLGGRRNVVGSCRIIKKVSFYFVGFLGSFHLFDVYLCFVVESLAKT